MASQKSMKKSPKRLLSDLSVGGLEDRSMDVWICTWIEAEIEMEIETVVETEMEGAQRQGWRYRYR